MFSTATDSGESWIGRWRGVCNSACPARDWQSCASGLTFRASAHCDQACLFGSKDVGRRRRPPHPVIVTEQHADPVELVFKAFLRLDPEQRVRLFQRLK
jgi:hypothetical protein